MTTGTNSQGENVVEVKYVAPGDDLVSDEAFSHVEKVEVGPAHPSMEGQPSNSVTLPTAEVEGGNKGDGSEPVVTGLNPRKRPFNLLINCAPEGVKVLRLTDLLPALNKRVEMEEGVPDYRLVQYGQGPGMLCLAYQALQHDAEQQNLNLHGDLVIDARTPEGATLLETISRYAANVVRGF